MQSSSGYKIAEKVQKKTPAEPFCGFYWVSLGELVITTVEHPDMGRVKEITFSFLLFFAFRHGYCTTVLKKMQRDVKIFSVPIQT